MKQKVSPTQKALNLWAIILIVWAVYRAKLHMPEWFDEFIAKPFVFVLPVFYYIKNVEKKPILASLNLHLKKWSSDVLLGFLIGGFFFVNAIFIHYLKLGRTNIFSQFANSQHLLLIVTLAFATSITEEILSRGFILRHLYEESKNIYSSSFIGSILFFFLHVPILFTNVKITGNLLLLFMGTDMILSFINSVLFLDRKNLALPILIHAFYNLSIVLFL